jgi:NAD(P)H-dependent FMN reductase
VGLFVKRCLEKRGFEVDVIDPLEPDAQLPLLERPHFAYARGRAPEVLESLDSRLRRADAYVCVTPEYNHAP